MTLRLPLNPPAQVLETEKRAPSEMFEAGFGEGKEDPEPAEPQSGLSVAEEPEAIRLAIVVLAS